MPWPLLELRIRTESVAKTIDDAAKEIDAGLAVCSQRSRGADRHRSPRYRLARTAANT
jgi:hypothetical protein